MTDESPDAGLKDFYFPRQVSVADSDNIALALAGIHAPVGADFIALGRKEANIFPNKSPVIKGRLEFSGNADTLMCWIVHDWKPIQPAHCATEVEVATMRDSNAELLSRYQTIRRMNHFRGVSGNSSILFELHSLVLTGIAIQIRHGEFDAAYAAWKENNQFVRRVLQADSSLIDKAIFMVLESRNMEVLEQWVHANPRIEEDQRTELLALLPVSGMESYNLQGALRTEYLLFLPIIEKNAGVTRMHPNFISNRFYRAAQRFLVASQAPPAKVKQAIQAARVQYPGYGKWNNDYLRKPIDTFWVQLVLGGITGDDLVEGMHWHNGVRRVLTLQIMAKSRSISGGKMPEFLRQARQDLRNPFTDQPMTWDAQKQAIIFRYPNREESIEARL